MIATLSQSLATDNLPVNWFDGTILALLAFGIFRGRKNGMSKEVLPVFQWIVLVIAAGLGYSLLAPVYHTQCGLNNLWSALAAYATIAFAVFFVFSIIKKFLMPRLVGSSVFGNAEYYLGMPSGMVRYACMIIFALALMNAKHYTPAEIAAKKAYNERWYGGGLYSGNYIPDLHSVQEGVFKKSFTGPYIKGYLGMLLIETGPETGKGNEPKQKQPVIHIGN